MIEWLNDNLLLTIAFIVLMAVWAWMTQKDLGNKEK